MIDTILFDLDGTLLPIDDSKFLEYYFGALCKKAAPYGYEPDRLIKAIWKGTKAMVLNDGLKTNEEVFWDSFALEFGESARQDIHIFDDFYAHEFIAAKAACSVNPKAREIVDKLLSMNYKVALATNPIFPKVATHSRIRWANMPLEKFAYISSYENCHHAKPNLAYYQEVLKAIGSKGENTLMIGNDVSEDMVATKLGMSVFLVTDCLLNKTGEDIDKYPHGNFQDLDNYLQKMGIYTK